MLCLTQFHRQRAVCMVSCSAGVIQSMVCWVDAVCSVQGPLCRNTHSRHPIRSPTAECRWKSINLCSFWHSAVCTQWHIYQRCAGLCVCAAHLSICVDSVAPRALAPGVGKEGSRELPAHYTLLSLACQPIFWCHHSIQTYHFVIPSARSNAPNDTTELLDFSIRKKE